MSLYARLRKRSEAFTGHAYDVSPFIRTLGRGLRRKRRWSRLQETLSAHRRFEQGLVILRLTDISSGPEHTVSPMLVA